MEIISEYGYLYPNDLDRLKNDLIPYDCTIEQDLLIYQNNTIQLKPLDFVTIKHSKNKAIINIINQGNNNVNKIIELSSLTSNVENE